MKFRGIVCLASIASFLVAALVLDTVHTYAQISNFTGDSIFRVGLKSIALPAPSKELIETGSDYRVILDTLTPVTNRLVAAFLLPEDLKAIQTGPTPLSRYALVEVPRRTRRL